MECKNLQHKKKCFIAWFRQPLTPEEEAQQHKNWTKSVQTACQRTTEQLQKDIELRNAVASISAQTQDKEDSDFRTGPESKTKSRIAKCTQLRNKLGKSEVNLVSSITKVVANTKEEQRKERKEKYKSKDGKSRKLDKTDNKQKGSKLLGSRSGANLKEVRLTYFLQRKFAQKLFKRLLPPLKSVKNSDLSHTLLNSFIDPTVENPDLTLVDLFESSKKILQVNNYLTLNNAHVWNIIHFFLSHPIQIFNHKITIPNIGICTPVIINYLCDIAR